MVMARLQILALALCLLPKRHYALLVSPPPTIHCRTTANTVTSSASADANSFRRHNHKLSYNAAILPSFNHATILGLSSNAIIESDASNNDSSFNKSETPLSVAMGVGVIASLVGYLYSKCMKGGFNLLWNTIPSKLFSGTTTPSCKLCELLQQYPAAYIVLTMTLGGGFVSALSTFTFPKSFSAHDFVHFLSRGEGGESEVDKFPKARTLLPVLLLSLLTSISGFSLGPEAPMVTAGGLIGVSLARKYLLKLKGTDKKTSDSITETLAIAGAAGTLTGFMNIPLAGPIFALEMVSREAGISSLAAKSWTAALAASFAGMAFVRGGLVPNVGLGGHFTYGAKAAVGMLSGREMVLASLGCGVVGAAVGTCFHKTASFFKSVMWPAKASSDKKSTIVLKKTLVALAIGLLSSLYPQTMFWGEGSLQCVVDGQCTAFSATPHGIPTMMTALAKVNPNVPFASGMAALQVGIAKFMAIALANGAAGLPGGVIFPLLSNGAIFGHALVSALSPILPSATSSLVAPLMVMSLMAATLTSITRTPLATVLILALTASGMTQLSVLLPGVLMASYVSVWVSERLSSKSFFSYSK